MSSISYSTQLCVINPLYTGGHFRCFMLEKSICYFRDVWSIFLPLFYFFLKFLHRQTGEKFVDPTAMSRQMREVSDF